jgi:hypothetical protein
MGTHDDVPMEREVTSGCRNLFAANAVKNEWEPMGAMRKAPRRRTQLEPGLVERGSLQLKRIRRAAVIALYHWSGSGEPEPKVAATPKERRDPLKLAHYYRSLLDSGRFENRAALARYLGVSRARATQVLRRLSS